MVRPRTPIPGPPGVNTKQTTKGTTTFALEVTRDDCVDFTLDLKGATAKCRCRRCARPPRPHYNTPHYTTRHRRADAAFGLRVRHQIAAAASPQTVVEDVEQGRHDNLVARWFDAVGPRDRLCVGGLWTDDARPGPGARRRDAPGPRARRPHGADGPPRRRGPFRRTRRGGPLVLGGRCGATQGPRRRFHATRRRHDPRRARQVLRLPLAQRRALMRIPRPARRPAGDGRRRGARGDAPPAARRWCRSSPSPRTQLSVLDVCRRRAARRAWRARAVLAGGGSTAALRGPSATERHFCCAVHQRRTLPTSGWPCLISRRTHSGGYGRRQARTRTSTSPRFRSIRCRSGGRFPRRTAFKRGPGRTCGCRRQSQRRAGDRRRLGRRLFAGVTHPRRPGAPRRRAVARQRRGCRRKHRRRRERWYSASTGRGFTNLEGHAGVYTARCQWDRAPRLTSSGPARRPARTRDAVRELSWCQAPHNGAPRPWMRRNRSWTSAFSGSRRRRARTSSFYPSPPSLGAASNHDGAPPEHRSTRDGGPTTPLSRRARAQYATFGRSPSTRWRRSAPPVATARQAAPISRISTSYSGEPVRAAPSTPHRPRDAEVELVGARASNVTPGPSPSPSSSGACKFRHRRRRADGVLHHAPPEAAAVASWCSGSVGTSRGGGSPRACQST